MSKPNIFEYATSELSQDAVLAYMLAWAAPEHAETTKLHELGQDFLRALLGKVGQKIDKIENVVVKTQDNNIDISVDINEKIFMIIEDKVDTMRHGDQIKRYKEAAEETFKGNRQIVAILKPATNPLLTIPPLTWRAAFFVKMCWVFCAQTKTPAATSSKSSEFICNDWRMTRKVSRKANLLCLTTMATAKMAGLGTRMKVTSCIWSKNWIGMEKGGATPLIQPAGTLSFTQAPNVAPAWTTLNLIWRCKSFTIKACIFASLSWGITRK